MVDRFDLEDLTTFSAWIEKYLENWAKCDILCNHAVGDFIEKHPVSLSELKKWATSDSRWLKRATAVSLIVPARMGKFPQEVLETSDILLAGEDEIVQKGYGWLLEEASRKHEREVFEYVVRNRQSMPRTALRYAIELLPKELKAKALKKRKNSPLDKRSTQHLFAGWR
jgi:3-methyladenine DNA glycosylase AlkD